MTISANDVAQYITAKSVKSLNTKKNLDGDITIRCENASFTLRTTKRLDIYSIIKSDISDNLYREFYDFHGEGGEISVRYSVDNDPKTVRIHSIYKPTDYSEIDYLIERIQSITQR